MISKKTAERLMKILVILIALSTILSLATFSLT